MSHDSNTFGDNYHWEHNTSNCIMLYKGDLEIARFYATEARDLIAAAEFLLDIYNPQCE